MEITFASILNVSFTAHLNCTSWMDDVDPSPAIGPSVRPSSIEGLLREPILDVVPLSGLIGGACYRNWELDHGKVRFYLSGYLEFLRFGIVKDTKQLGAKFGESAIRIAETETNWTATPGPHGVWKELSANQFRAARRGDPMYFQKAALVLLAAEAALADALKSGKTFNGLTCPADVYSIMKIVPACYNVDAFTPFFEASDAATLTKIAAEAKQPVDVLRDLAEEKMTVTASTAMAIAKASGCGPARGKPGRYVGNNRASKNEKLDLG